MEPDEQLLTSLDELAGQAARGDAEAASRLCRLLRVRFLQVAKRRVQEADAEDVVQDALRIVLVKYRERATDSGILVWSFSVLRNVIGNYYQAQRRERRYLVSEEANHGIQEYGEARDRGLESLPAAMEGGSDLVENLARALDHLARTHPRCGAIFRAILASTEMGGGPREISSRALLAVRREWPDMNPGGFYVALHRCRANLRDALGSI